MIAMLIAKNVMILNDKKQRAVSCFQVKVALHQLIIMLKKKKILPSLMVRVASKLFDDDREQEATINGRAGRATGRNKFWFNIQNEDKPLESLNFEALEHWKELPTEEVLLYGVSDQVDVKEAKLREFQSWFDQCLC